MRRKRTEMQEAMALLRSEFPSCVQGPINRPIHNGKPNPSHGKYYIVGRVPAACLKADGSCVKYDTEEQAIAALIAAGMRRIQRVDCSFVAGEGMATS